MFKGHPCQRDFFGHCPTKLTKCLIQVFFFSNMIFGMHKKPHCNFLSHCCAKFKTILKKYKAINTNKNTKVPPKRDHYFTTWTIKYTHSRKFKTLDQSVRLFLFSCLRLLRFCKIHVILININVSPQNSMASPPLEKK